MKLLRQLLVTSALVTSVTNVMANNISIMGSNSMSPLMEVLTATYMKNNSVNIGLQAPGSSAGIKAVTDGSVDIGMSSRDLMSSEKSVELKEVILALDGIAVIVNSANGVENLSMQQLAGIYRGEITNWSQVGGPNAAIVVMTRDTASGTRGAFEDIVNLKRDIGGKTVSAITARAQVSGGNGPLKVAVSRNKLAIGYISVATIDSMVKAISIDGQAPSIANIRQGNYKVVRNFWVLYKQPHTAAMDFITWMRQSSEARAIIEKRGYIYPQS